MRDGRAERAVGGPLGVDVDPLVIAGRVGEEVDPVLFDGDPLADTDVGTGRGGELCGDAKTLVMLLLPNLGTALNERSRCR